LIGLYPKPFFNILDKPVAHLVEQLSPEEGFARTISPGPSQASESSALVR